MAGFRFEKAWRFAKLTYEKWSRDNVPQLGASLAFYTALSIAPILVISLAVGAFVFGDEAARGEVAYQMRSLIGSQGAHAVEDMIESANKPASGVTATVLGVVMLLFGASGVFGELQQSLNKIWEVEVKENRGFVRIVRERFFSFVMVLGIAFLLLVSLVLSTLLASLGQYFSQLPDSVAWLSQFLNFSVSFVIITLLFAMIFKILPDANIAWWQVWLGASLTALLFSVGKFFIGLYLGRSSMASSYGVAGSFVVLLVWVYYSSQILYLGAEMTKVYADLSGGARSADGACEACGVSECVTFGTKEWAARFWRGRALAEPVSPGTGRRRMGINIGKIFCDLSKVLRDEVVETLAEGADVRIERIVSHGHASPSGFWYDQDQHEWVILLKGAARLRFEDGTIEMKPGDFVNLPAHKRHRVDWTTPDEPTIWLAVHYGDSGTNNSEASSGE